MVTQSSSIRSTDAIITVADWGLAVSVQSISPPHPNCQSPTRARAARRRGHLRRHGNRRDVTRRLATAGVHARPVRPKVAWRRWSASLRASTTPMTTPSKMRRWRHGHVLSWYHGKPEVLGASDKLGDGRQPRRRVAYDRFYSPTAAAACSARPSTATRHVGIEIVMLRVPSVSSSNNIAVLPMSPYFRSYCIIGPILWGHSGPLCHALSSLSWTSMRRRRATVAACDSSDTWWMGVRRLAVANGPNIFKLLLVSDYYSIQSTYSG